MATSLLFADSFDHYATAQIADKWTTNTGGVNNIITTSGRFGNRLRVMVQTNGTAVHVTKQLPTSYTEFEIGFAFIPANQGYVSLLDSAGATQLRIVTPVTGAALVIQRGDAAATIGTGTTLVTSAWHHVNMKVLIGDAGVGQVQLRLNGVDEIHSSGGPITADTQQTAVAGALSLRFGTVSAALNNTAYMDDLYVFGGTGVMAEGWRGDCRVEPLYPTGNGNSSQFVGSDGNSTDNYLLVDETTPATADYAESPIVGNKDTYVFGNLTNTTGTVHGIQVLPYVAKTDAGVRNVASVARLSTTEEDSADKVLVTAAQYMPDIRETKPGGGAWTIADVNAAEFGLKVTA